MNDVAIDEAELQQYIGRSAREEDLVTAYPIKALRATLGLAEAEVKDGDPVPPGWHGLYFLALHAPETLGADGLPLETGVMPPLPLPRRMFAGQQTTFHQPLRVGERITRKTELIDIAVKQGQSGQLVFATLKSEISGAGGLCLEEEYGRVFREELPPEARNDPAPSGEAPPEDCPWRATVTADPVMLFRYSALTFNGHRIHYDRPYATGIEGYPGTRGDSLSAHSTTGVLDRKLPDSENSVASRLLAKAAISAGSAPANR